MGVNTLRGAIATLCLVTMSAQPALAACWSPREVASAKVRDLQTVLMVAALQCRGGNSAILASYNQFVNASRAALGEHNGVIRAHFIASDGRIAGERSYDAYTTRLANGHSRDISGDDYCGTMAHLASVAADTAGSELVKLADEVGLHPVAEKDACSISVAAAQAGSAVPPAIILASAQAE